MEGNGICFVLLAFLRQDYVAQADLEFASLLPQPSVLGSQVCTMPCSYSLFASQKSCGERLLP